MMQISCPEVPLGPYHPPDSFWKLSDQHTHKVSLLSSAGFTFVAQEIKDVT